MPAHHFAGVFFYRATWNHAGTATIIINNTTAKGYGTDEPKFHWLNV
jgi:hypothetical protein